MDQNMRFQAKVYIGLIVGGGAFAVYRAVCGWHSDDLPRFLAAWRYAS